MAATTRDDAAESAPPRPFAVVDAASANWVVRKILAARAYRERVRNWAMLEERKAVSTERRLLRRFGVEIEGWLREELGQRGKKAKSVNLPAGRVGLRQPGPKLTIDDEESVCRWARATAPHLIKTVESVPVSAVNEYFKDTGELPDGVTLATPPQRLYVS